MIIGNITQNNHYNLKFKLSSEEFYDLKLSNIDESVTLYNGDSEYNENTICYIDFLNPYCFRNEDTIYGFSVLSLPNYTWSEAVNEGLNLPTYWLTGLDVGRFNYTTPFIDWLTNFSFERQANNFKFYLYPINGYIRNNAYYISRGVDGLELNGGFVQGVFKVEDKPFQLLPTDFSNKSFEFVLNRDVSEQKINILNDLNPNNSGIFFYMGTRAENKFWYYSERDKELNKRIESVVKTIDGGDSSSYEYENTYDGGDSSTETANCWVDGGDSQLNYINNNYYRVADFDGASGTTFDNVFSGGTASDEDQSVGIEFFGGDASTIYDGVEFNLFDETPSYLSHIVMLDENYSMIEYLREHYQPLSFVNTDVIDSDNKFLFFNNTEKENTYTTDTWNGESLYAYKPRLNNSVNYYTTFNQSLSGQTTDNSNVLYDNVILLEKDIINNCIAFRFTDDNRIGYRTLVANHTGDTNYSVLEEYSEPLIVSGDTHIVVKTIKNKNSNIVVYFYVNGVLVFSSSELPEIIFHALDEVGEKQYGVPYNVSIGGGTLGLYESFLGNDLIDDECKRYWIDNVLPIEENFAGTFIGTIKKFKMYDESLTYDKIKNNFKLINNNVKKIFYGIGLNIYELNQLKQNINFYLNGYGSESDYVSLNIPKVWGVLKSINIKTIYDELIPQTNWFTEPVVVLMNNIEYYSYTSKVPLNGNANFVALF